MDLYEYQARDLFGKHGVPVLPGIVATTSEEAEQAAIDLGGRLVVVGQSPQATSSSSESQTSSRSSNFVVVKAQVKTGGHFFIQNAGAVLSGFFAISLCSYSGV